LYELYINEEEQLKNEWNELCKVFEDKLMDKNARLSRKFYQLFKEQSAINYDDVKKCQINQFEKFFFALFYRNFKNKFEHIFPIQMHRLIIY
jgi:predicted glycoside hydrolase/deacetylase ChbG (UPF0249 family)